MRYYRGIFAIWLALCVAASLAACGAGHSWPSSRPARTSPPGTSPAAVAAPTPNDVICQKFGVLAPALTAVVDAAQAHPASLGRTPGAIATLRRAASLLDRWSDKAKTTLGSKGVTILPLDLLTASDEMEILVAGYGDPGAGKYAADAGNAVGKVTADCASQPG